MKLTYISHTQLLQRTRVHDGGGTAWQQEQLRAPILIHSRKQRKSFLGMVLRKACPQRHTSFNKPHLILLKQFHQLMIQHSSTCTYEGHSHSNHHTSGCQILEHFEFWNRMFNLYHYPCMQHRYLTLQ